MDYKEDYIDYMIQKISTLNIEHFDMVKDSLEKFKTKKVDIDKELRPIHFHYYENHKLDFLDYYNYRRCRKLNLNIK